jgi:hypothetical protein
MHSAAKDSFINIERSKQMAEMQARYETEKKEKQILQLEKSRLTIMGIAGGLTTVFLIACLAYMRISKKKWQKRYAATVNGV